MNLPTSNKGVANEARVLQRLDWAFDRTGGDGHHVFVHPDHGTLRLPGSPGNPRWLPEYRQRLAALMGMSKPDLERTLGERPPKRTQPRQDGPGRTSNESVVVEHASSIGIELSEVKAARLISRFGGLREARRALDAMARLKRRNS